MGLYPATQLHSARMNDAFCPVLACAGHATHDELSASILYFPTGHARQLSCVASTPGHFPDPQSVWASSTVTAGYPLAWSTAERSAAKPPEVKADLVRDLKLGFCGLGCKTFGVEGLGCWGSRFRLWGLT